MGALVGACALLGAAACADVPTGVEPASPAASRTTSTPREVGPAEVFCTTSYATPGGTHAYQYGWVRLKLPASARAKDGSTRPYRFRSYVGQTMVQAADCVVPNTELARVRVDQLFGVKRTPKPKRSADGEATLFGDEVGIEGIDVYACQNGNEWPDCEDNPLDTDPGAYELNPCGDSPDCYSGSTGGGGSSGPPAPTDQPGSDEWQPDPANSCDTTVAESWGSDESHGCDAGPFMLKSTRLEGCPATAQGWAVPANSGGVQYYDLRRPGTIRAKSFGGVLRYDVAYYEGTVIAADGTPSPAKGEVWCSAGIGIFTF